MHARGWMRLRPQQKSAAVPQQQYQQEQQQQEINEVAVEADKFNERGGSLGSVQWFEIVQLSVSAEGWIGRSAAYPTDIKTQRVSSRTTLLGPSGQHAEREPLGRGLCNLCRNCTCHSLRSNGAAPDRTTAPNGRAAPNRSAAPNGTAGPSGAAAPSEGARPSAGTAARTETATANRPSTSPNGAAATANRATANGTASTGTALFNGAATPDNGATVSNGTTAAANDGARVRENNNKSEQQGGRQQQQQQRRNEQRTFNWSRGRRKFSRSVHEPDPNRTVRVRPAEHGAGATNGERYCEQSRANTRSRKLLTIARFHLS